MLNVLDVINYSDDGVLYLGKLCFGFCLSSEKSLASALSKRPNTVGAPLIFLDDGNKYSFKKVFFITY